MIKFFSLFSLSTLLSILDNTNIMWYTIYQTDRYNKHNMLIVKKSTDNTEFRCDDYITEEDWENNILP